MEIVVDCGGCADKRDLHVRIARALNFPDWYGYNLDALMDCLTDLEETTLVIIGYEALPFDAAGFWETFTDAMEENPSLTVRFDK